MRAPAFALVLSLAAACGGGGSKEAEEPKQASVDERKAEKDAKGLVTEIYQTLGHGSPDSLMALLSDPLIVFGPRKSDALATRADALVSLRDVIDKKKPQVRSEGLAVVPSEGGLSAWAVDTINVDGIPMAVTAVLVNSDDIWVVSAASIAIRPSMKSVRSELKQEAVVPPAMTATGKVEDGAGGAVDRFKKGLANPAVWADDLGKRSDAVVVGPSAGDVTRGKKDIAKLWKKRAKVNVRHASAGDVSAGTTPDGKIAWVTAPVVRFEDDEEGPLPLRLFSVFEKSGGDWKMIALQESVAFDEPGQGASFKKIAAPAVKTEEPPPKKEEEKKPPPKKKKKKKKSDDE